MKRSFRERCGMQEHQHLRREGETTGMSRKHIGITGLILVMGILAFTGCGSQNHKATPKPNSDVTYEKGADLTGVVKKVNTANQTVTFYNPVFDNEETFSYTSATGIQSKNGAECSIDQVEIGGVYDLYIDNVGSGLTQMLEKDDLVTEEDSVVTIDSDKKILTVDGVNYSYSDHMVTLSDGRSIDPMEITAMDRVTFRGVKGKAYSVVVTRGHGYIQPMEYGEFVGGTITIEGEAMLPVSEGMLLTVPEGTQKILMKNGNLESEVPVQVERNKLAQINMKKSMTQVPNTARVTFHIFPEGAELYINGSMVDYSKPITMYYGIHTVKVVLEGYNDYLGRISVKDPEPVIRINLAEETAAVDETTDDSSTSDDSSSIEDDDGTVQDPSSAELDTEHKITISAPEGTTVYVNGSYQGVAPCHFVKMIGNITLTLQKDGYQTKSYTIEIVDDSEDVSLSFPELKAE